MSVSSSTASGFNFDGVVSGLKTGDIITKLMSLEQAPIIQLQNQQAKIQARDKAYQDIAAKGTALRSATASLLLQSALLAKTAASSAPTFATATAGASAVNGSFSVNVLNLATATSATSNATLGTAATMVSTTKLASAGLTITPSSGTFTINGTAITVDASATGDTWASLQTKISTATGGAVTLSLGANGVSLSSAAPMQLGTATDTSNLLTSLHLAGAPQTGAGPFTVASNQLLGEALTTGPLSSARLNVGGGIAASGGFMVNGVAISWTDQDSINDVLNRINGSSAGVSANYDPKQDTLTLANTATGASSISLSDTTGNFLQAMHVVGAAQQYGTAASYTITQNGVTSATQYSNNNNASNVVPGVSLTLVGVGLANINIGQDTQTAITNVNTFVTAFNGLLDQIDASTKYDAATKTAALLTGDPTIQGLADQLRSMVSAGAMSPTGATYTNLASIGISTGALGAATGSTNHLVVDTAKLTTALQTNSQAAFQVLSGFSGTTSVTGDATNPWIASTGGTAAGQLYSGSYRVSYDPTGNTLSSVFTPLGGSPQAAILGTISAGGVNSTLIPGLLLTARTPLPGAAGTDTITHAVTSRGIMQVLNDFLPKALGASGIFQTEKTESQSELTSLSNQIAAQNERLAQRQQTLQAQFTAMETALARLNSQSAGVLSGLGIAPSTASSSSSG
jgi:flagellar hook-associated protein 2